MTELLKSRPKLPTSGYLLCVDPSKPGNNTGLAYFWIARKELAACHISTQSTAMPDWSCDCALIEIPQVYPRSPDETEATHVAKANDCIQVTRAVGQWEQVCAPQPTWLVLPRTWKKQVDKRVHNARVLDRLSAAELALLTALRLPESKRHNVIDAIGLGLWALGRM